MKGIKEWGTDIFKNEKKIEIIMKYLGLDKSYIPDCFSDMTKECEDCKE